MGLSGRWQQQVLVVAAVHLLVLAAALVVQCYLAQG
jgi:hypothetical protein